MSAARKADLKRILREDCLPALGGQSRYYSAAAIKGWLQKRKLRCPPATLNRYLHAFTRAGLVFAAGRGWYSSLATPFVIDTRPVNDLADLLRNQFRFLKFSCWSTDQVRPFMQHLLARSMNFISAEEHALRSVGESLEASGYTVYVNPKKSEVERFVQIRERTVILRPEHSKAPEDRPFAGIEKLLVELRVEVDALKFIDVSEFHHLAGEALRQGRVQISALLSYAEARLFSSEDLFGKEQSIISKK
jgi:hypothetical protein